MRKGLRQACFYQKNPTGAVRDEDKRGWKPTVGHGIEPDFPRHEVGKIYIFHVSRWKGRETK